MRELKDILNGLVATEQITRDAFAAQENVVRRIAEGKTEEEFAAYLEGRLGPGLARVMASRIIR